MATQLFANNAASVLASGITNVATSLTVTIGHGARFPSPSGGDYFLATLCQQGSAGEINFEIVKVTARSTDTFTVVRAQEGTTGLAYNAGDKFELRLTKGTMERLQPLAFNIKDFGAVGDGNADDTVAVQAAIDAAIAVGSPYAASVFIPSGRYKLTATIVIDTVGGGHDHNISLYGEGTLSSSFARSTDYGDTFQLNVCPQMSFRDFGVQMYAEMTNGAHFNCTDLYRVTFTNLYLTEPYIGFLFKNCTGVFISKTVIVGGQYFTDTSYKTGSAMVKLAAVTGGLNNNIAISDCQFDWSSLTPETGSKYQHSIWCESVDGVWISNAHITAAHLSQLAIKPLNGYTLSGVRLSNCWIDFWANRGVEVLGDGTQIVQDISLSGCMIQGATQKGIYVNSPYLDGMTVTGCTIEYNQTGGGSFFAGKNISLTGNVFKGNNGGATNGRTLIVTSTSLSSVTIQGNVINGGPGIVYNIDTGAAQPINWAQGGNVFNNASISDVYLAP